MPSKVSVRDLRKSYGAVAAVRGVSFDIGDGEIFGLLGPNGAGKTTTLECVIGLREPDAGTIEVCGIDARRRPREVKQQIGAALQTPSLPDKITPREALALFGSFYRRHADPERLLDRFSLSGEADVACDTLSGGQRQRLALALAFVNTPDLVFLDEPTAGLDPQSRRELRAEIMRMKADGHTVLLTTHDMEEAGALCDRIAVINCGVVIAQGAPHDLIAGSRGTARVSVVTAQAADAAWLATLPAVEDLKCDGTTVEFRSAIVARTLAALMQGLDAHRIDVLDVRVQKASLEDVFLELTRTATDTVTH